MDKTSESLEFFKRVFNSWRRIVEFAILGTFLGTSQVGSMQAVFAAAGS